MARIYVGNLPLDIRTRDIEDLFWKYGRIRDIDLKSPSRPPAFAFVYFEDIRDAEDAIRGRDGVQFEGARLRVEMSRGSSDAYGGDPRGGGGPPPRRPPPRDLRRSEFRVIVSGLPPSASWQDLKDFFRQAGDVIYTDVDRQGGGIVEFGKRGDQEYALEKMDRSDFTNPFHKGTIRVKKPRDQMDSEERARDDREERDRDRSRSRDRRKRSRSRSRSRSKSRSRSRDRRSRSRSRSRSRDRGGRRDDDDDKRDDRDDERKEGKEEKEERKEEKEEKKDN